MREIMLTKGQYAQVDDEEFDRLMQYHWCFSKGYAVRYMNEPGTGRRLTIPMHHLILPRRDGLEVDHINGIGTDNQRANLRLCTHQQNMANRLPRKGKRYKGITWRKRERTWYAQIRANGKDFSLGFHKTEREAALAYDKAARQHFGEYARLNFPETQPPAL